MTDAQAGWDESVLESANNLREMWSRGGLPIGQDRAQFREFAEAYFTPRAMVVLEPWFADWDSWTLPSFLTDERAAWRKVHVERYLEAGA